MNSKPQCFLDQASPQARILYPAFSMIPSAVGVPTYGGAEGLPCQERPSLSASRAPGATERAVWGLLLGHLNALFGKIKGITLIIFKLIPLHYNSVLSCGSYLLLSMTNNFGGIWKTHTKGKGG